MLLQVRGSMVQDGVPSVLLGFDPCVSLVERCVKAAFDSLHLLCLAPARQRYRCEASIKDWAHVQTEAHQVDCAFMVSARLITETAQGRKSILRKRVSMVAKS